MSALLLLVACLVLGALVARIGHPPAGLAQGLNWWVINIAFAALVVHVIPTVRFDWQYWFLAAALWLVFLGAWAVFATLGRALHWSRARIGALTLGCGLGNTAFIGLPMIEAFTGARARSSHWSRTSSERSPYSQSAERSLPRCTRARARARQRSRARCCSSRRSLR
jgi:predicted permease